MRPPKFTPKPAQPVRLRKKSFFQKITQIQRIRKRALLGAKHETIRKEFLPLIEEMVNDEQILRRTRDPLSETVRRKAEQNIHVIEIKIMNKIQQLALSRALAAAMVFSPVERKVVRVRMEQVWHSGSKSSIPGVISFLKEKLGFRHKVFYNTYTKSIAAYHDVINFYIDKTRQKQLPK